MMFVWRSIPAQVLDTPAAQSRRVSIVQRNGVQAVSARRLLPMAGLTRGERSPVTCWLKCDNACARQVCNTSSNEYFRDFAAAAMTRWALLGTGPAGAMSVLVAACTPGTDEAGANTTGTFGAPSGGGSAAGQSMSFERIEPADASVDSFDVPQGYTWTPILRWGDPLLEDSPEFDIEDQSAQAQRTQFGYNNDFLAILPTGEENRAVLYCNHEYVNPELMFPADGSLDAGQRHAIEMAAHGGSVVQLQRASATEPWQYVRGGELNRRITATTPMTLTGPAAGSQWVVTEEDSSGRTVRGMMANCAGGTTPWGTILSGEENFHGYFRAEGAGEAERRYGLTNEETTLGWESIEPRFDARTSGYRNEPNRYGYVVEIDPQDRKSTRLNSSHV